ncbi:pirin family protein [Psychrobacter sanguinis]|uniref:pirin family protein n=1 Tax=Psychrobacter sanguinis TaxID=861445 RepID=UPI00020C7E21|nr:pirin family protein [Psychrobacter sanguinis]EGK13524.1 short-chain dehydrogenase/reductase family oxidoreductase [Psychrobacter sp. 1501(2011)]MCD9150373.1 pirin family protein [Psychrobacter sanguinis]
MTIIDNTQQQQANEPVVSSPRSVEHLFTGIDTQDGAGVKLTRVLTQELQQRLDPYLMLDNFKSDNPDDYIAGFPNHPHRGFETITYMISGRMRHKDSAGNEGLVENGGVQWMTAASGVIHSEIPEQEDGDMEGFQLWLNLPAKDKMKDPWYKDFQKVDLPQFTTDSGANVTVIAGESHGIQGAVTREVTEPTYLDIHLPTGSRFSHAIPADHNAFVFVYRGSARISDQQIPVKTMAILKNVANTDGVIIEADTTQDTKVILITGHPLNEPIVQYGPFVMNTQQQIIEAINDFQQGRFGEGL